MMHAIMAAALTAAASGYSAQMKAMRVPGMQVVVVDHGKVVRDEAFGVKNVDSQDPVDVHTRFEIGSITKQFTAAAILQLKEHGKLSLDDKLGKYVPQYVQGRNITLRRMLLQISGIPNYTDTKAFGKFIQKRHGTYVLTRPGDLDAVVALLKPLKLDFAPGTKWEYSNSNYYLLGRVVEVASGMPWSRYIDANIFKPAGMTESTFMEDEAHVADMATGYTMEKKGNYVPVGSFRGWAGGAGTIVSTATDLAKWDAALFSGKIVSNTDLKLMTAPGPLPALRTDRYGFGWVLDTFDGQPRIWHNGGTLGFNSSNQIYPKSAQTVIVLTNMAGGADSLANGIFDSLHPDLAAAKSKTVSGEDAAITARAKTVWAQFLSGNLDRSQFTGEMNKALTPDLIAGAKAQFGSLGDATSWVYRGKNVVNGMATYTYRVSFSSGTSLNVYMSIDKNDKIAGYLASPN